MDATPVPLRSVLVVDDSAVECMLATAVLQRLGFSAVVCAASAEQALLLLAARRFDLAICDISLPGMDGLELLAAIRACPAPPPCIVLSAHDDARHARAALQSGALAYLVKPLRLDNMRETLAGVFPHGLNQPPSALCRLLAALARACSRRFRPTAGAAGRPGQSAAAALLQAGIRATG